MAFSSYTHHNWGTVRAISYSNTESARQNRLVFRISDNNRGLPCWRTLASGFWVGTWWRRLSCGSTGCSRDYPRASYRCPTPAVSCMPLRLLTNKLWKASVTWKCVVTCEVTFFYNVQLWVQYSLLVRDLSRCRTWSLTWSQNLVSTILAEQFAKHWMTWEIKRLNELWFSTHSIWST